MHVILHIPAETSGRPVEHCYFGFRGWKRGHAQGDYLVGAGDFFEGCWHWQEWGGGDEVGRAFLAGGFEEGGLREVEVVALVEEVRALGELDGGSSLG